MMDETPFHRVLRWRVHDPAEALWIAATHRSQAADARAQSPATIAGFRDSSRQRLLEERAKRHDDTAVVCEQHAAALLLGRSERCVFR